MRVKATVSSHAFIVDQPLGKEKRILMARLAYKDHRWRKWSFPGGFVDEGEKLGTALVREVMEEIGLRLQQWQQVEVTPMLELKQPHIAFIFLSDAWEGKAYCRSRELLETAWVNQSTFAQIAHEETLAYPLMVQQVACLGWHMPKV